MSSKHDQTWQSGPLIAHVAVELEMIPERCGSRDTDEDFGMLIYALVTPLLLTSIKCYMHHLRTARCLIQRSDNSLRVERIATTSYRNAI